MAFIERNLDPSASGSSGLARGVYRTADTLADCEAAGYFNDAWGPMRSVASLLIIASDDSQEYAVTAINGTVALTPILASALQTARTDFFSRAAAMAAKIPVFAAIISVLSAGVVCDYVRDVTGTALTTADGAKWSPANEVRPEHWGAVRNGVTDDVAMVLAARDYAAASKKLGKYAAGKYAVSSEIRWKSNCRFTGAGNWSAVSSPSNNSAMTTTFVWIGAVAPMSAVFNISSYDVGVEGSASGQLENIELSNLTVDGAQKAGFCVYWNRSWSNNKFDYLTVTGATEHGGWAGNVWNATIVNPMAYKNIGCGLTFGVNTFGWVRCVCDESTIISAFGYYSGINGAGGLTVRTNAADETDAGLIKEAGITIGSTRGTVFINPQASQCGGFGILLLEQIVSPLSLIGGYVEGNGKSTGFTTKKWDFGCRADAGNLSTVIERMHFGLRESGVGTAGGIRLWGAPNDGRPELAITFKECVYLPEIWATHGVFKVENCGHDVVYTNVKPIPISRACNGMRNLDPIGYAVINATSGAVVIRQKEGIIANVTWVSAGLYQYTFDRPQPNADFGVIATSGNNRIAGAITRTTNGFRIQHTGTGTPVDSGSEHLTVQVFGTLPVV